MYSPNSKHPLGICLLATALVACGQSASDGGSVAADVAQTISTEVADNVYQTALAHPARSDNDRARDAGRNPAAVLKFAGIEPGMTVLDLFTGGGYYAEILARVVGSEGKVIAQTNQAYMNFGSIGDEFSARFADDRLPNVETLMAENNELSLAADSIDAAMLVLSFHDLYLVDVENGWPAMDVEAFLAELRNGLRPGGSVVIIDHVGAAGVSPVESGNSVHRIDPAAVISAMDAAGFTLRAQSDLLRNPDDDLSKNVFAEGVRGNTDRFVMTFSSPD